MEHQINWDKLDKLESIARKYVLWTDMKSFFERLNLPPNFDTHQKIFTEKQSKMRGLFTQILDIDNNNLFGNFGMFYLESYTGSELLAEKYALRGMAYNRHKPEVYELRSSLAEFYEQHNRLQDANELYIANISFALSNMKFCIDDFFKESGQKLLFSDVKVDFSQDKEKTALNTYLNAETFKKYAVQTQNPEVRKKFTDAKRLQDCGHYGMANETLSDLDTEFSDYEIVFHVGIIDLQSKVEESYNKNIAKFMELSRN
jgi:hypothetical protein